MTFCDRCEAVHRAERMVGLAMRRSAVRARRCARRMYDKVTERILKLA